MANRIVVFAILVAIWLLAAPTAHAYFSPTLGRFINRDPGLEPGRGGEAIASGLPQRVVPVPSGYTISRPYAGRGYHDGMSLYRAYFVPGGLDPSGLENIDCEGKCGAIVDDWIVAEIEAQEAGFRKWYSTQGLNGQRVPIDDYLKWANGNQRYKDPDFFQFNKGTSCGTKPDGAKVGCGRSVTLGGKCVRASILGNIIYGYVGFRTGWGNDIVTRPGQVKGDWGMTVDTYDEAAYAMGIEMANTLGPRVTLEGIRTFMTTYLAANPNPLREGNASGGYNDLTTCKPCTEKTKESRHGGSESPRIRP